MHLLLAELLLVIAFILLVLALVCEGFKRGHDYERASSHVFWLGMQWSCDLNGVRILYMSKERGTRHL